MTSTRRTVWVLADQLDHQGAALADADPRRDRILVVESAAKLRSRPWHRQRAHLVVTALRRFTAELRERGFEVDHRRAPTMRDGLAAHVAEHAPSTVVAMEPMNRTGDQLLRALGVELVRSNQFLCHRDDVAAWAGTKRTLRMEDFYRWQRRRLGYLMDGDEPVTGRWNYDQENRKPPPRDGSIRWPAPIVTPLDALDHAVIAELDDLNPHLWGAPPDGVWATDRAGALARLDHVVAEVLPGFGPHEDAMLAGNWHLAHTLLSPYLNLGLLRPAEVADAIVGAYAAGRAPIESCEGLLRQVIGWREYVHGVYWLWGPAYAASNALGAHRPLPPVLTGRAPTEMRCVATTLATLHDHGWVHHIQRLMVLGNLALLAGVEPQALADWMWAGFVDGADWVMVPNVIGMSQHADGGRMASKPYAAGGAYIDSMSDYCRGCRFDRKQRTGPDACPFTTLYWDFLARHEERFARHPRVAQQVRAAQRLADLSAVRARAVEVLGRLDTGEL